ncbi:MAG: hypothetical protein IKR94_09390 [Bacteroidales bacterium]|nr:hypothetical protein [Bacteroidales bacterium]
MIRKTKFSNALKLMAFCAMLFMQSCFLFEYNAEPEYKPKSVIVLENGTSDTIHLKWMKPSFEAADEYMLTMDNKLAHNQINAYTDGGEKDIYVLLRSSLPEHFKLIVTKDTKCIEYPNLKLESLPESVHSVVNINSWVKDKRVIDGDTLDALSFTFTDKDFE